MSGSQAEESLSLFEALLSLRRRDLDSWLGRVRVVPEDRTRAVTVSSIRRLRQMARDGRVGASAYFLACDLYIRQEVEPFQAVLDEWMRGAKAQVDGEDVEFNRIVSWCQDEPTKRRRDILEKEARSLCRFLRPFSIATWQATFRAVTEGLGYGSYLDFLLDKKDGSAQGLLSLARRFIQETRSLYFKETDTWFASLDEPVPAGDRSRFDAIHLIGLRYMDHLYPADMKAEAGTVAVMETFARMMSSEHDERLVLHVRRDRGSGSVCIPVEIPRRIHVVTCPLDGWVDLEALFHELGHAFFYLNADEESPVESREFCTESALSEAFAFLFQLTALDAGFLTKVLGVDEKAARRLSHLRMLKFLVLARRYGVKALVEHHNFSMFSQPAGQDYYARLMSEETGFRYHPETYFFDLMPDLYSLDYFTGFVVALILRRRLEQEFGHDWLLTEEAYRQLGYYARKGLGLSAGDFVKTFLNTELNSVAIFELFSRALDGSH